MRAMFTQGSIKQSPKGVQKPHTAHKEQGYQWPVLGHRSAAKMQLPKC